MYKLSKKQKAKKYPSKAKIPRNFQLLSPWYQFFRRRRRRRLVAVRLQKKNV